MPPPPPQIKRNYHTFMYMIVPSCDHSLLTLNMPFKVILSLSLSTLFLSFFLSFFLPFFFFLSSLESGFSYYYKCYQQWKVEFDMN